MKELEQLWECFKLKASSECAGPLPWLFPPDWLTAPFLLFLKEEKSFCHLDCCTFDCCLLTVFVVGVVMEGGIDIRTVRGDSVREC